MKTNHDPSKRAEARVERWRSATPPPQVLADAADGLHLNKWQPVRGPHLRVVRSRDRRNKTGCVGISYYRSRKTPDRSYFCAQLGPTCRKFCVETLGRQEAWRRAVAARAEHETKVARANAAIFAARRRAEIAGGAPK